MNKVLANSTHLMGSEGKEYDAEEECAGISSVLNVGECFHLYPMLKVLFLQIALAYGETNMFA
jgi:hypothetical protein